MLLRKLLSLSIVILSALFPKTSAQELKCNVEINFNEIESTSTQVFKTLEAAISEYMNTTQFTKNHFSPTEKIDCRLFFNIKEYNNDNITAELTVQSNRPVYNSTYITPVLNFKDNNVKFNYREFEPLVFSTTNMESQLTAILNYYAYLILALDFDSFSPRGGQEFFDRAQTVVLQGQSAGESGWRMFEDSRNRAAVLSAFTDGATQRWRDVLYNYHRKGLDEMATSPDKGRSVITGIITDDLPALSQAAPMSVGLAMFRDSKLDELMNIYSRGTDTEKKKVVDVLGEIYPTDQSRVKELLQKK